MLWVVNGDVDNEVLVSQPCGSKYAINRAKKPLSSFPFFSFLKEKNKDSPPLLSRVEDVSDYIQISVKIFSYFLPTKYTNFLLSITIMNVVKD